jgi:multidrug efflux system membrane fusion protein
MTTDTRTEPRSDSRSEGRTDPQPADRPHPPAADPAHLPAEALPGPDAPAKYKADARAAEAASAAGNAAADAPSRTAAPKRRRGLWITLVVLIVIAAAAGWFWHQRQQAAAQKKPAANAPPPPVAATTAPVKKQDLSDYRAGIGTVTAARSVTVKARVDGQLDSVGFTEGQDVKEGQIIARIDPRTLQASLAQAQATRAKDAATLANAKVDLGRYTQLLSEEAATPQQQQTQKALVDQLTATVQTDDALINYAKVQLSFTTIAAPISGRVGARLVDPGNIVHAADTNGLVVINQIDPITVLFTLPEEAFQDVNRALNASKADRQNLMVQAYPRNGGELLGTGRLILLNNQIDVASGTVQLKGLFPNPFHKLWPGQYVNVRLVLGERKGALTVPAQAIMRSPQGTYVYVVDPNTKKVANQPVEVALIQEGTAVITKGVTENQRVVVDGQYKLRPGGTVSEGGPKTAGGVAGSVVGGPAASGATGSGGPASGASIGASGAGGRSDAAGQKDGSDTEVAKK